MPRAAYECPKCGSDRVKKLSLVYEDGVSRTLNSTVGVGGSQGGLGAGVASSRGLQQTETSRRAAPPEIPRRDPLGPLIGFLGVVVALLLLGEHSLVAGLVLVGALWFAIVWSRKVNAANRRDYAAAKAQWDRAYLCERCGEMFALAAT